MREGSGSDSDDCDGTSLPDPFNKKSALYIPQSSSNTSVDALRSNTRGLSVRQMVDGKAGAPAVGTGHGGSRDTYTAHKIIKLQETLNKLENREADLKSSVFKDCWCFFNGTFSDNSIADLKHMVVINGGSIDQYKTSKTTHLICDYYTDAQITSFHAVKNAPFKSTGGGVGGLKYVTHRWILQSIEKGSRQPEVDFVPDGLALYGDSKVIRAFLHSKDSDEARSGGSSSTSPAKIVAKNTNRYNKPGVSDGDGKAVVNTSSIRTTNNANIEVVSGDSTTKEGALVKEFHMKSRLSYIGSWRNRLPQMIAQINATINSSSSGSSSTVDISVDPSALLSLPLTLVLHVDLDCFFVSALLARVDPSDVLRGRALAVAHSQAAGSSEVSCCNYPARARGVAAGMYLSTALKLCPELKILQYDFDRYDEVSSIFYRILYSSGATAVEPVSVDEAYLEFKQDHTIQLEADERSSDGAGMILAERLRARIFSETNRCSASVGIGANKLLARVATRRAKPDGKFEITDVNRDDIWSSLELTSLPGIGRNNGDKLREKGFVLCCDVLQRPLAYLKSVFGNSIAEIIYNGSRGVDNSRVEEFPVERQSVGAEINYGVRLCSHESARNLISELSREVCRRLAAFDRSGRKVVCKVMLKQIGSKEPSKFMGHGLCDSYSKTITLKQKIRSAAELEGCVLQLYGEIMAKHTPRGVSDVRGMGIQVSLLEPVDESAVDARSSSSSSSSKTIASYFSPGKNEGARPPAAQAGTLCTKEPVTDTIVARGADRTPPQSRPLRPPLPPAFAPFATAASSSSVTRQGGAVFDFDDFDVPSQVDWAVVQEMSPQMAAHIKQAYDWKTGLKGAASSSSSAHINKAWQETIIIAIDDDEGDMTRDGLRPVTASQEETLRCLPSNLHSEALRQMQAARPQTRSSSKPSSSSSSDSKRITNRPNQATSTSSKANASKSSSSKASKKRQPSVGTLFAVQKLSREVRESGASIAVLAEGIKADAQQQSLLKSGANSSKGCAGGSRREAIVIEDTSSNISMKTPSNTKRKDAPVVAGASVSENTFTSKKTRVAALPPSSAAASPRRQHQSNGGGSSSSSSIMTALSSDVYEKRSLNGLANELARQKPAAVFSRMLASLRQMSGYDEDGRITFGPSAEGLTELYEYGRYLVAARQLEQANLLARHYEAAVAVLTTDNSTHNDGDNDNNNDDNSDSNYNVDSSVDIMNSLWRCTTKALRDAMDGVATDIYRSTIDFH